MRSTVLSTLILVLLGCQTRAPEETSRAVALLEPIAGEAVIHQEPSDRVRLLAEVAALLWPYDAPKAKAIFERALDQAAKVPPTPLRAKLFGVASRHDPALAATIRRQVVDARPRSGRTW